MKKTIALIGSLDTKETEIAFVDSFIKSRGFGTCIIDTSVRGKSSVKADIGASEILCLGGLRHEDLEAQDKAGRISLMSRAIEIAGLKLYNESRFHAVLSMGGVQNTTMATAMMKQLPFGIPKFMVSTMASGQRLFGPMTGTKDITIMHSVADISGLNGMTKAVLKNAASAVMGMLEYGESSAAKNPHKKTISATMLGITNRGAAGALQILQETGGFETIAFHANGVGGRCMEEAIQAGLVDASLDLTTHELTSEVLGGYGRGITDRLMSAAKMEIPQVIAPGGVDVLDFYIGNGTAGLPSDWENRKKIYHNSEIVHLKVTREEIIKVARLMAERLNRSPARITVLLPLKGFCEAGAPSCPMHDPEIDGAFIEVLKQNLKKEIKCIELEYNINDPEFALAAAREIAVLTE
ncbi:MAG: Tm-1-like ATP-binding domain-containing protein [Oligoflexales bacterium]|nr:Tm-1-like ATP-binding domain-containing protein [Oligoflexales bacterium]